MVQGRSTAGATIVKNSEATIGAIQLGIGMISTRIAEIVLRDERAVIPIGVFNPKFRATLSMPGILGRSGVSRDPGTRDDRGGAPRITEERRYTQSRKQADRRTGQRLSEKSSGHLDVARHPDLRVSLQRFSEQRLRLFAITWGGAIK